MRGRIDVRSPTVDETIQNKDESMNRMMTLFWALFLSLVVMPALNAQRMMMSPEERAQRLQKRLSLSDEQASQVRKIYEESQENLQDMMQELTGDRELIRKAMTERMENDDKKIEELLTAEQKKKFEEVKKERRQRRQGAPRVRREPPR